MKKYIGPICWLAAVVIWVTISWINYAEGNMGLQWYSSLFPRSA